MESGLYVIIIIIIIDMLGLLIGLLPFCFLEGLLVFSLFSPFVISISYSSLKIQKKGKEKKIKGKENHPGTITKLDFHIYLFIILVSWVIVGTLCGILASSCCN